MTADEAAVADGPRRIAHFVSQLKHELGQAAELDWSDPASAQLRSRPPTR